MRVMLSAMALAAALAAGAASAQTFETVDLSGRYRCVSLCLSDQPGQFAYITQSGRELNVVNDAGNPSRGWIDRPGRIWVERANQGAIYSPDGMTIQFDRGTVWQRDLGEAVAPRVAPGRRAALPPAPPPPPPSSALGQTSFDGSWNVTIVTRSGPCDPQYQFGAQIVDGNVAYDGGGPVNLQGQVAPNGNIWVSVSAGGARADGEGRLSRNFGTGAWRGQGSLGACVGTWEAVRRG